MPTKTNRYIPLGVCGPHFCTSSCLSRASLKETHFLPSTLCEFLLLQKTLKPLSPNTLALNPMIVFYMLPHKWPQYHPCCSSCRIFLRSLFFFNHIYKAKPIPVCHSAEFIDYILCAASRYSNLFCLLRKASPHTSPPLLAPPSTKDKYEHLIQGQLSTLSYAFCSKCSLPI